MPKTAQSSASAVDDLSEFLANEKILVAEDNKVNQMVIANMLRQIGCSFDIANNGEEACRLFEQNNYFLVFMDLMMPVMDGLEATRRITSSSKFIIRQQLIVALTASVTEGEIKEARAAGCSSVLSKPVSNSSLKAAIRAAAKRRMEQMSPFALGASRRNMAFYNAS